MSTDKLSLYLQVNGADEATKKFNRLGKDGMYALNGVTASAKPVSSALVAMNSTVGKVNRSFGTLQGLFGAYVAKGAISGIIETNKTFQGLEASLTTVEGSSAKAAATFALINEMASQTPYAVENLTQAWIRLEALGLKPSQAALLSYGNTASAMNKDIIQFIEAIADAATMEFERLKEFGIKARQQGEEVSFTFQGTTTTIKKNAADITKYLEDIGNNQFAGAMERQMATLTGATSNLGDTFARIQKTTGDSNFNDSVIELYSELGQTMAEGEDSAKLLGTALATVTDGVTTVVKNLDVLRDSVIAFAGFKALQVGSIAVTASMTQSATATKAMAFAVQSGSVVATRAMAVQAASMTASGRIITTAMGAVSLAARGMSASFTLLGGIPGLLAIAGFSIYQMTKETNDAAKISSKYADELEKVKNQTRELTTATDDLRIATSKTQKLEILTNIDEIKEDITTAKDELLNGSYWSNNWFTNQIESFNKDSTFDYYLTKFEEGKVSLRELESEIRRIGETSPEHRDMSMKFIDRLDAYKAATAALFKEENKLAAIDPNTKKNFDFKLNVSDGNSSENLAKTSDDIKACTVSMEELKKTTITTKDLMNDFNISNNWSDGFIKGLKDVKNESLDLASTAEQAVKRSFSAMEDSLLNFVKTGKLNFTDLANSIIDGLLKIQIQQSITQPLSQGLSAWASSYFSSGVESPSTIPTPTYNAGVNHVGGSIGSTGGLTRNIPMEYFANAPRYHTGTVINKDEEPAILLRGEGVVDRQTMNALLMNHKRQNSQIFNINIENNSGGSSEAETSISENANGANISILFEKMENKIASDVGRDRGSLAKILNHKYKLNGANI